ncbi:MAG: carbohydrate ABC transporter permease [Clostridia bacterium]|nr:carbohydrate ABC transporter permease [Clostridia bacterium]
MAKSSKLKKKMDAFEWVFYSIIILYVISLFVVLGFGFFNSFKDWYDFDLGNVLGMPREKYGGFTLQNYSFIITNFRVQVKPLGRPPRYVYIEEMLYNSVAFSIIVSLFSIATQVMVSYACAKYEFKLKGLIYMVAVIVMMVPIVGSLAAEMQFATELNLKNNFIGIAIMCCKYPGIYFLVFYASFKNISSTYMEAAEIDGAGHLKIFLQIMLPMVMSSISAVFVLQFIANFNNYQTPMLFAPERTTVAYGLFMYQSSVENGVHTTHKLAASIATAIPLMILFFIFRNKIMGNLTMGGIKG